MKWKGFLILFGGLLTGGLLGFLVYFNGLPRSGSTKAAGKLPLVVGSPVPDFELPLLTGGKQKLSALKGKAVIVNFWATWCLPCKEEMPLLNAYAGKYPDRLVLLGVNFGEDVSLVRPYVADLKIGFPILLDQQEQIANMYFVRNLPVTFFIDADGMLRAQHLGTLREDLMARYLETIGITE